MGLTRSAEGDAVIGGLSLSSLVETRTIDTPAYVYDVAAMADELLALRAGFGARAHLVCYAVKANPSGYLVRRFAALGAGFDVVSLGELSLCLACGVEPSRIVYSGVAKTSTELDLAISSGILSLHAESIEELERASARAVALGKTARVSLRLNPGVEADTHAHIATGHDEAKFGISVADAAEALSKTRTLPGLSLVGLSSHIGSQMTDTEAYVAAARRVCEVARASREQGARLEFIDLGGGFGIDYGEGCAAHPADFVREASRLVEGDLGGLRLLCEPGRSLVGAHGVLVARVVQQKRTPSRGAVGWLFVDAGMNDLIRPALYAARHRIEPLTLDPSARTSLFRVAGPVCESSDDFGIFELPDPPPEVVVIRDAGAYGHAMASQYNGRKLAQEVFVDEGRVARKSDVGSVDSWVKSRL